MITPQELKELCLKGWKDVLVAFLLGADYFPKEITRIGKVTAKDLLTRLVEYKAAIAALQKQADIWGYTLILGEQRFDKIGTQLVPQKIVLESREVYLRITNKKQEFALFCKNHKLISSLIPALDGWCRENPLRLIDHTTWSDCFLYRL